ncbi:MAG: protease adaptor protein RcdA [Methylovirgula sp.]
MYSASIELQGRVMVQVLSFEESGAVSFAAKLATSESFKSLFREGMNLVEETASYLDGDGREEARGLPRLAALAFATESMRLTTRLMQLASWLLLQRAVNEGELTQTEASSEKRKVKLSEQQAVTSAEVLEQLPPRLTDIVDKSLRLQSRILHLDRAIYPANDEAVRPRRATKPLDQQRELLRAAFATAEA